MKPGIFLFVATTIFAQQGPAVGPFRAIPPAPLVTDRLAFGNTLPDFETRDLAGHTWRLADLRGKLTVVQLWATWCLPCRQEHPALQEFFNETRRMNKVQVLTFSGDADPSRVLSYMKEKGYTFPVIVDRDLEARLFPPANGIPDAWVIDSDGRRSQPFQVWTFGRVLLEVERLAMSSAFLPQ
jgi:peroxiredoxin